MRTRKWMVSLTAVFVLWAEARGQTCGITNPAQPFSVNISRATNTVILSWSPTCTNYAFGVFSTDQLTSNSVWQSRAGMWGSLSGLSQWSDTGITNRQRFFKVLRTQPTASTDWNGDGIPDVWELNYGLNPFSSSDATNDPDSDGYSDWDEYLMGSNPTNANDPVTMYVDPANRSGTYDGSQANPFQNIQDAIESSVPFTSNLAIRVRPGTNFVTVSNLQYDPSTGNLLGSRQYLYIYAANQDWSLSTDPESHVIDSSGMPNVDLVDFSSASAPTVEFNGVARARINGFKIRGGQGGYAGGIYAVSTNNGPIYISNCIIEKNGGGNTVAGGIYIQAATNSMIYNTVVAKNVGEVGGIYDVNGVRIWNCTIVSNVTWDTTFGAVTGGSGAPNILNSIIWSNGFGALDLYFANVDYSTFGSNAFVTAGLHNLSVDPILVNMLFGNYRLQTNTTVRGAGLPLPLEPHDLYGNPRPVTGSFDIGANQYTDSLGDGIQDDWKSKHGFSLTVSHASEDPDGDGLNNLQEYNSNTDPYNPDTDGDGISDGPNTPAVMAMSNSGVSPMSLLPGPDPDPTTPDISWNTVFWDGYFESQFETYINGVAEPQWINEPDTRPCTVTVNNFHVGDHVNLQWQYLGGQGFYPFLVFYVPAITKGNIIPDLSAVPLNQIQVGESGYAPPNGPWGSTIAQTTLTNSAGVCPGGGGYDDETPKLVPFSSPWLSVPQSGSNTVTVSINPTNVLNQVIFDSGGATAVSVSPAQASGVTQVVQVVSSGTISNANPNLYVRGYGAQNSYTTTCNIVAIDVLPKATNVTVAIYKVVAATMTNNPPNNVPSQADLKSYLDSVYGTQANIYMTVLPLTTITVNYDLNGNGKLDYTTNALLSAEQSAIKASAYNANAVNVYYVNTLYNPLESNEGITYGTKPGSVTFIQSTLNSSSVNITAHEIGHALGLQHPNVYGQPYSLTTDRLMRAADNGGSPCRLIQREWNIANGNAK